MEISPKRGGLQTIGGSRCNIGRSDSRDKTTSPGAASRAVGECAVMSCSSITWGNKVARSNGPMQNVLCQIRANHAYGYQDRRHPCVQINHAKFSLIMDQYEGRNKNANRSCGHQPWHRAGERHPVIKVIREARLLLHAKIEKRLNLPHFFFICSRERH